jgi:hypothetical protein
MNHATGVSFYAPDIAYAEAREHLPALLSKRGVDAAATLTVLDALEAIVRPLAVETYQPFRRRALSRIGDRDPDDWPALATRRIRRVGLGPPSTEGKQAFSDLPGRRWMIPWRGASYE